MATATRLDVGVSILKFGLSPGLFHDFRYAESDDFCFLYVILP